MRTILAILLLEAVGIVSANPAQKSLFLYYDYFKSDDGTPRDPTLNSMLTDIESEVAFGGNNGNFPVTFGTNASTSVRLCPVQQDGCGSFDSFTTANVLRYLQNFTCVFLCQQLCHRGCHCTFV